MKKVLAFLFAIVLSAMCACSKKADEPFRLETVAPHAIQTPAVSIGESTDSDATPKDPEETMGLSMEGFADAQEEDPSLESVPDWVLWMAQMSSDFFSVEESVVDEETSGILLFLSTNPESQNESIECILTFAAVAGMYAKESFVKHLIGPDAVPYNIFIIVDSGWDILLAGSENAFMGYISSLGISESFEQENPDAAQYIEKLYEEKFERCDVKMILENSSND